MNLTGILKAFLSGCVVYVMVAACSAASNPLWVLTGRVALLSP
jgi:hypothetical protein